MKRDAGLPHGGRDRAGACPLIRPGIVLALALLAALPSGAPRAQPASGGEDAAPRQALPRPQAAPRTRQAMPGAAMAAVPPDPVLLPVAAVEPPALLPPEPAARPALPAAAVPDRVAVTMRLPFPAGTGAAAVVRGGHLLMVFDTPRMPDLDALRRLVPGFGGAHAEVARGVTKLHLPLAAADGAGLRLLAGEAGWALTTDGGMAGAATEAQASRPADPPARLLLPAGEPGRVVALRDPVSDELLLIGTSGGRHPVAVARPDDAPYVDSLELLPTRLGVVVRPLHDEVSMRSTREGFVIALPRSPSEGTPDAPGIPTLLDLPDLPRVELLGRRHAALAAAAAAPPQARGMPRLALSEALLALGFGAEAQSLAVLTVEDDPRLATSPRALLLLGASSLAAGRVAEAAAALADPRLDAEPEALLWRAMARAAAGEPATPADGTVLTEGGPNLSRYPAPLRGRLVPFAAVALVEAGRLQQAQRLLADREIQGVPQVVLAQARVLEAQGRREPALAAYAMLARSRNALARMQAMERAAELRLAAGSHDARRAAMAIEGAAAAWRGDGRELALRLRAAALWREAGEHAAALVLLEETALLFPDSGERVRVLMGEALQPALNDPGRRPDTALRLAVRYPEALPSSPPAIASLSELAKRATEARQPTQSAAALGLAMSRTEEPQVRGRLALRLAASLLADERPAEARVALREAPAEALAPAQREERTRIEAEALRRGGDAAGAASLLGELGPAALPDLAEAHAARRDWVGAADALARHVAAAVPAAPAPLEVPHRELLLRLASFASLAGDESRLAAMRESFGPRFGGGSLAQPFLALVGGPATPAAAAADAAPARNLRVRDELEAARRLHDERLATR